MIITADTNFLVSATQWDYSVAHKLLIKLIKQDIQIFTTREILDEFANVLKRDFKYDEAETNNIIEKVLGFAKLVEAKEKLNMIKDDSEDNKILECAIASNSNYIVTYDKHLLNLKEFRSIKILKPEDIMKFI